MHKILLRRIKEIEEELQIKEELRQRKREQMANASFRRKKREEHH